MGETDYWEIFSGDLRHPGSFSLGPQTSWEFVLPERFSPETLNFPGPQISREKVKEPFFWLIHRLSQQ